MDALRRTSLFGWSLRSHRTGVLGWGGGIGLLLLITSPAYVVTAKAVAGGIATLGREAEPVARSFAFLTGPPDRLDTIGGYLSYKAFTISILALAIYAAVEGAQVVRGAESRGLMDLWIATGMPRATVVRHRLLALAVALGAVMLLVYCGSVIGGGLAGENLLAAAVTQSVMSALVLLFFFALSLLISQFVVSARSAAVASAGIAAVSYVVANTATSLGPFGFLRFLSPFWYYLETRSLVPGLAIDWPAFAVVAGAVTVVIVVATRLVMLRDIGGVILARVRPPHRVRYDFHPSRLRERWLWSSWVAEQRLSTAWWFAGLAGFVTLEVSLVPQAITLLRNDSGRLGKLLARNPQLLTTETYLSYLTSFAAMVAAGFAIYQVGRWVGDATHHRIDAVLAAPVPTGRLILERAVSLVILAAALGSAVLAGYWVGTLLGGFSFSVAGVLRTVADIVLLCFAVGGVGMALVTVLRSGAAIGLITMLVVGCFILTTIAGILNWPSWASSASVFEAFGTPYTGFPALGQVVYLLALGLGGMAVAEVAMRRGARTAA